MTFTLDDDHFFALVTKPAAKLVGMRRRDVFTILFDIIYCKLRCVLKLVAKNKKQQLKTRKELDQSRSPAWPVSQDYLVAGGIVVM